MEIGKMLLNMIWWMYSSSICTLKEEMFSRSTYHYENFLRNIQRGKQKKDVCIDLDRVDNALQKGVGWLESIQRKDGCIGGRLWEIWDTAHALLALTTVGGCPEVLKKAADFLMRGQSDNGSFYLEYLPASREDIADMRELYCIETTSAALMGIYRYKLEKSPEVTKGLNFILKEQRTCGGWKVPYLGNPNIVDLKMNYYPATTSYALRTILLIEQNPPELVLEKALDFLETTQHTNGSWEQAKCFYNTESYAIKNIVEVLVSMKSLNWSMNTQSRMENMVKSAVLYIKRKQNSDGSWSAPSIASKSLCTSLYLRSLLIANDNNTGSIDLAVDWMLKNQEEGGFWKGGYYGHLIHPALGKLTGINNDLFTTSEALITLNEFKNHAKPHELF